MQDQLLPELFLHFPTNVQTILPARTLSRMFLYLSLSGTHTNALLFMVRTSMDNDPATTARSRALVQYEYEH